MASTGSATSTTVCTMRQDATMDIFIVSFYIHLCTRFKAHFHSFGTQVYRSLGTKSLSWIAMPCCTISSLVRTRMWACNPGFINMSLTLMM